MDDSLKSLPVVDSNASAKAGKVPMGAVLTAIGIGVAAATYLLVGAYWTSQAGKQSSLWLAEVAADGSLLTPRAIAGMAAGAPGESLFQPLWIQPPGEPETQIGRAHV